MKDPRLKVFVVQFRLSCCCCCCWLPFEFWVLALFFSFPSCRKLPWQRGHVYRVCDMNPVSRKTNNTAPSRGLCCLLAASSSSSVSYSDCHLLDSKERRAPTSQQPSSCYDIMLRRGIHGCEGKLESVSEGEVVVSLMIHSLKAVHAHSCE